MENGRKTVYSSIREVLFEARTLRVFSFLLFDNVTVFKGEKIPT